MKRILGQLVGLNSPNSISRAARVSKLFAFCVRLCVHAKVRIFDSESQKNTSIRAFNYSWKKIALVVL